MTPELIALLVAAAAGAAIALRLDRRAAGSLVAGEALLFGIAISAGVLFFMSLIHVSWSRLSFGLAMAAVLVPAWGARWRSREASPVYPRQPLSWLLHAVTVAIVAGYGLFATIAPVWEFDFIDNWGLKARAFAIAHAFDWKFLEHPFHFEIHPDYPPLLTLAFDSFAVVRGAWNDQTAGLLNVAFAAALLLIVHRLALEETGSPMAAALVTLSLAPFACSPWIGLAEGPLVAYATAGFLLIRRGSLAPGAVMLGLAALTKNEGLTFIIAAAVALAVDKRWRELPRLWPAAVLPLPWLILRRMHALQTDLTEGNVVSRVLAHLRDPGPLLNAFAHYGTGKPFFWIALAAGVVVTLRELLRRERFVLVALLLQFLFYIGAYLATPHDVDWHVHWSWERLISHLSPLLTYVVLVSLIGDRSSLIVDREPQS